MEMTILEIRYDDGTAKVSIGTQLKDSAVLSEITPKLIAALSDSDFTAREVLEMTAALEVAMHVDHASCLDMFGHLSRGYRRQVLQIQDALVNGR